jgi:hypothetical protein
MWCRKRTWNTGQRHAGGLIEKQTEPDQAEGSANLSDSPGNYEGSGQTKPVDEPIDEMLGESRGETERYLLGNEVFSASRSGRWRNVGSRLPWRVARSPLPFNIPVKRTMIGRRWGFKT